MIHFTSSGVFHNSKLHHDAFMRCTDARLARLWKLIGAVRVCISLHNLLTVEIFLFFCVIAPQEMTHMMTSSFQCPLEAVQMHRGTKKNVEQRCRWLWRMWCRHFQIIYFAKWCFEYLSAREGERLISVSQVSVFVRVSWVSLRIFCSNFQELLDRARKCDLNSWKARHRSSLAAASYVVRSWENPHYVLSPVGEIRPLMSDPDNPLSQRQNAAAPTADDASAPTQPIALQNLHREKPQNARLTIAKRWSRMET